MAAPPQEIFPLKGHFGSNLRLPGEYLSDSGLQRRYAPLPEVGAEGNMVAAREVLTNPLESYLTFSEPRRGWIYAVAGVLIVGIAYSDWKLEEVSVGFLYVLPILMASATLRGWHILAISIACGLLREWFSPLHGTPGATLRVCIGAAGFGLAGYFVSQLNRQRQAVARHLSEREQQMRLRINAERQLQVVIETSPLGILTLNSEGRVLLANSSAQHLLRLEQQPLAGQQVHSYLPILQRFLSSQVSRPDLRTAVESKGLRADGETFLAHIWLSTFSNGSDLCLAAFIWDASESLRDRESTGLDSMMATSRVVIGAISHEIRNLAAAALAAYRELARGLSRSQREGSHALGRVIEALENIAASGLRLASHSSRAVADLGMVLDEARVLIDASLRDEGGVTEWRIPDTLPLVEADHHSLLQVFLNLARNSEQAMRHGPEKTLRVEVTVDHEMVLVRFRDTGPGIADLEALFRPLQPGGASTGLGLYISRAILKSYAGDLYHEPGTGGACFVVRLWPVSVASNRIS
jgi:two-component system, LuxR family, sensor kinase FixL